MEVPQQSTRGRIRFGAFEVDVRAGELRHHGTKIRLQQQPFRILALLLESPGEVVTREELRQAIWPATFVEFDEGLDAAIHKLRYALGDSADHPRFIETLPRRGYRFIATVDDAGEPPPNERAPRAWSRYWPAVLAAGLVLTVALLLGANIGGLRDTLIGGPPARIRSIAVLPLDNLSGDSAQEYFAAGMTEALVTTLGGIGALHVISQTSATHYKGTRETLPEIARQLHADAVLEGAVLRVGRRVRITVQLVDASTDRHVWAETYESDLRDVLVLQDKVARAITNEVRIRLSPREQARLAGARPVNPEAYDLYLQGRYEWSKWTDEGLKRSIEYFEQAVRKDSGYAPAWAGLSDAYDLLAVFGYLPMEVALPKAKVAALRAIELDDGLSEAHVSLAGVLLHLEWSWSAAERELQRAIALNPNNAMAHQWYGYYLTAIGQLDAAITEMRRALELDPLSPNKQTSLAGTLYRAGRYHDALQYFLQVPDPDGISESRHRRVAAIYERQGREREAMAEWLTALRVAGKSELARSVERAYRASGYPEARRTLLWGDVLDLQRRARNAYPRPLAFEIAADYALLGERSSAFEWLQRAVREREVGLMYLKVDDRLAGLRSDPRFRDLLRRTGLPADTGAQIGPVSRTARPQIGLREHR
jgi:TolB-like protein/DNA-binding winged helix-turn-helix (wHTH) protein